MFVNSDFSDRLRLMDGNSDQSDQKRRAFYLSLRSSGLVKHIKTVPPVDFAQRQLVQVQGPPVSQTIIEDRR
jgi:hypothetical protein